MEQSTTITCLAHCCPEGRGPLRVTKEVTHGCHAVQPRAPQWGQVRGTASFAGQSENFQVYEWGTDGTLDNVLVNDLAIGYGHDVAVPVYSDSEAGSTAYLQVVTEDANWQVVVLSGTS